MIPIERETRLLARITELEASLAACRALVPKWRRSVDAIACQYVQLEKDIVARGTYQQCADELEAVLPLAGESQ